MLQDDDFEGALIVLVSCARYLRMSNILGLTWERLAPRGDIRIADRYKTLVGFKRFNAETEPL